MAFTIGGLLQITVIRAEGIDFAPLWRYTIPAFIVVPCVVALYPMGPLLGAVVISAVLLFSLRCNVLVQVLPSRHIGCDPPVDDRAHGTGLGIVGPPRAVAARLTSGAPFAVDGRP